MEHLHFHAIDILVVGGILLLELGLYLLLTKKAK